MDNIWMIVSILAIAMSLLLLINPRFAYNFGSREKREVPANWHITGRIFGTVTLVAACVFLYFDLKNAGIL